MALQKEPFLTMFYTINLSPLLVTKKGFMLNIILSNYQKCPLPLKAADMFGYCHKPVLPLGVSKHSAWNSKSVNSWTQLVIEVS